MGPWRSTTGIERLPLERVSGAAAVVFESGPRKSTSHDGGLKPRGDSPAVQVGRVGSDSGLDARSTFEAGPPGPRQSLVAQDFPPATRATVGRESAPRGLHVTPAASGWLSGFAVFGRLTPRSWAFYPVRCYLRPLETLTPDTGRAGHTKREGPDLAAGPFSEVPFKSEDLTATTLYRTLTISGTPTETRAGLPGTFLGRAVSSFSATVVTVSIAVSST